MKLKIFLILFLVCFNTILSQETTIKINSLVPENDKITKLMYGSFLEFLNDFINGDFGLWAQELKNRGFDEMEFYSPRYWTLSYNQQIQNDKANMIYGGYNPNGLYYINFSNNDAHSISSLNTKVYVYDSVGGDFYVYLKSPSNAGKVYFQLSDTISNEIYFKEEINNISKDWKKFSLKTPKILEKSIVKLSIIMEGVGELDIDEASFMAEHNVNGIKKEYSDIFLNWKPGILRYPGGGFADTELSHWLNGVGDIDKRKSPNGYFGNTEQRMDFGTDEFIQFCRDVDAEPHIVVNLDKGTATEAANWVEYCNGDTNTIFGKLRKDNGHPEPYNVKYWEIGNEQWYNATEMSKKYLPYYWAMKKVDPSIMCMVDGDIWQGKQFLDDIYDVIGENNQFYSYHSIISGTPKEECTDEELYGTVVAGSELFQLEIDSLRSWLKARNLNNVKLALTELLLMYNIQPVWIDTNWRNCSLEAGLWMAGSMNVFLKNRDILKIMEKTFGLNHIRGGFNKNGKRIIYSSPIHTVLDFYKNNNGKYFFPTEVICSTYNPKYVEGLNWLVDVPYLDVLVTGENDFLYLNVLNRHIDSSIVVNFDFPFEINGKKGIINELSGNFLDFNTPDEPDKVKFKNSEIILGDNYTFPPTSFTSIKIPLELNLSVLKKMDNFIKIFPNPAQEIITIELQNPDFNSNYYYKIFDLTGRVILEGNFDGAKLEINLQHYFSGLYFLQVNFQNGNSLIHSFLKM